MEKGPGAARNEDRRYARLFIEIADAGDEGRDRLLVAGDHARHELVAHHKIRRAGVLIDEQQLRAGLHRFNDIGSLGSASAGVLRREAHSVFPIGEILDEKGNIDIFDAAAVFRAHFDRRFVRDDELAPVAANVVVDTLFESVQEGGLPVVTTADDQCDAPADAHSAHGTGMGKHQSKCHRIRALKRHRALHRER